MAASSSYLILVSILLQFSEASLYVDVFHYKYNENYSRLWPSLSQIDNDTLHYEATVGYLFDVIRMTVCIIQHTSLKILIYIEFSNEIFLKWFQHFFDLKIGKNRGNKTSFETQFNKGQFNKCKKGQSGGNFIHQLLRDIFKNGDLTNCPLRKVRSLNSINVILLHS